MPSGKGQVESAVALAEAVRHHFQKVIADFPMMQVGFGAKL
jgi:hypothetical protein